VSLNRWVFKWRLTVRMFSHSRMSAGRERVPGGHPSSAGRAQDSEISPVRDRRSTTVPRNHVYCSPVQFWRRVMYAEMQRTNSSLAAAASADELYSHGMSVISQQRMPSTQTVRIKRFGKRSGSSGRRKPTVWLQTPDQIQLLYLGTISDEWMLRRRMVSRNCRMAASCCHCDVGWNRPTQSMIFQYKTAFFRAMICISVAYAVVQRLTGCMSGRLSGRLSVRHVRVLCQNGLRYGYGCYGMSIGNHAIAFDWYHFQ